MDKNIRFISVPDCEPDYPRWPGYVAPYKFQDAADTVRALVTDKDISKDEVKDGLMSLLFDIFAAFEKELSLAQRDLWALEGLLKGKSSGR